MTTSVSQEPWSATCSTQRERFVANVTGHLGAVDNADILDRALDYWRNVDADTGAQIVKNFGK